MREFRGNMKEKQPKWAFLVELSIGFILCLVCASVWDLFSQTEPLAIVKILSDSFFVPGAVFVGVALIGWVSSKGTFDIFGYSIRGLFYLFKSESYYKQTSFYDYRVKKQERRKSFNRTLLLSGIIFLLLGAIATTVFLIME